MSSCKQVVLDVESNNFKIRYALVNDTALFLHELISRKLIFINYFHDEEDEKSFV